MNAIEAIIYCIGYIHDIPQDGYFISQRVFDKNKTSHWIAWDAKNLDDSPPIFCSETDGPFTKKLEPYSM